jgi:hypothetical protein
MIAIFAIAGAVFWGAVGASLGLASHWVQVIALGLGAVYALAYGAAEFLLLPIRPPTSRWQVPAPWVVRGPSFRPVMIWAATLGPGVTTVNPYASLWIVPIVLLEMPDWRTGLVVGAAFGVAHGVFRAVGIILNTRGVDLLVLTARNLRWRALDGLALTVIGGSLLYGFVHAV